MADDAPPMADDAPPMADDAPPMADDAQARPRVAMTGASGLIASHLRPLLEEAGFDVLPVGRGPGDGLRWDPATGILDPERWEGLHAVVSLAGERIDQRWTPGARKRIWQSRVEGNRHLTQTLAALDEPPKAFIAGSAIGYYGHAEEPVDENATRGEGFLAELVEAWEDVCAPAREAGIRTVHIRTGIVLAREGGALPRMLLPFRLGLGGPIGSGKQWFPWVHIEDEARAFVHALEDESMEGVANCASPGIVRQKRFGQALGKVLRRPAFMPLPGFVVRILFGRMGQEALLWGQNIRSKRLRDAGFTFRHEDVEAALRDVLDRPATAK